LQKNDPLSLKFFETAYDHETGCAI
jgi:hypothetical protein